MGKAALKCYYTACIRFHGAKFNDEEQFMAYQSNVYGICSHVEWQPVDMYVMASVAKTENQSCSL